MNIGTSFINATKHSPFMQGLAQGILNFAYNALFIFTNKPLLSSDNCHFTTYNRHHTTPDGAWYTSKLNMIQYYARQNTEGLWDIQRVSSREEGTSKWAERRIIRLGADLDEVRALFDTQINVTAPTGQEFKLRDQFDTKSALLKNGFEKWECILIRKGNYHDHPLCLKSFPPEELIP